MKKDRKLKVGLVFDDSLDSNDGVAQYVKILGAWLSDRGHEVIYLVGQTHLSHWHKGIIYSLAKNLKVIFNGNRLSMPLPARRRNIKKLLSESDLDILHVMVPYSPFMAQKVINLADSDTAVVGTFHVFPSGRLAAWGSSVLRLICGRSLKRFGQIVSVSPAAAAFAKHRFGLSTAVIPNAVDLARFTGKTASPGDHIVFLGRLVKRKGCLDLLRAFCLVHQVNPDARLTIAGDGPERKTLENFVRRKGLRSCVNFLGFIDEKDKPGLLASADIACFPSLGGEAFGIVLIEAMAAGSRVVLGGDNPGYRSVLGAQPELLINPRESTAFANRLRLLLENKKLADELHQWQLKVIRRYDIDIVGQQILDLYTRQIALQAQSRHNKVHGKQARNG